MRFSSVLVAGVIGVTGLSASDAGTADRATAARIVFASVCYGETRTYSVLPDGSDLAPLLLSTEQVTPLTVSADGSTIAYRSGADPHAMTGAGLDRRSSGAISVSRADGGKLRRAVADGSNPVLSRDGRLLAFWRSGAVWVVGSDGRRLRRLSSASLRGYAGNGLSPDWSPDDKSLVFTSGEAGAVVIQPLHGKQRRLVPHGGSTPRWSPDGRWIAYDADPDGLTLVHPDGTGRHTLAAFVGGGFTWSPDGRRLAVLTNSDQVVVTDVVGHRLRTVKLGSGALREPFWSPDGRSLALRYVLGQPGELDVLGGDGLQRRRLTSACANIPLGWTRVRPALPASRPSEGALDASTVATRDPVEALSADGGRVAFFVSSSPTDCEHADVWSPGVSALQRLDTASGSPCRAGTESIGIVEAALAGDRVAWASWYPDTNGACASALSSRTLGATGPIFVANAFPASCRPTEIFHLRGSGDLLAFNDRTRLVRIGAGTEKCTQSSAPSGAAAICATLRQGAGACCVETVTAGLIAVRGSASVTLLDGAGKIVRAFTFAPSDVKAARLDGDGGLVVWRPGRLELWSVANGARGPSRPLPTGYRLVDADHGIAVLAGTQSLLLLRLTDGKSLTLKPGRGPLLGDLETSGLFYAFTAADGGGRVVFLPAARLAEQLDHGKR